MKKKNYQGLEMQMHLEPVVFIVAVSLSRESLIIVVTVGGGWAVVAPSCIFCRYTIKNISIDKNKKKEKKNLRMAQTMHPVSFQPVFIILLLLLLVVVVVLLLLPLFQWG